MVIVKVLEECYGKYGVVFLVDEGVIGILEYYGVLVVLFGMVEKGLVNVKVKIEFFGGYLSVFFCYIGSEFYIIFIFFLFVSVDIG